MAAGTNSVEKRGMEEGKYCTFDYLSAGYSILSHKPIYEQFGFFIGIIGPGCNCCTSKSFSDAECDCRPFRIHNEVECGTIRRPSFKLRDVFQSAFSVLQRLCDKANRNSISKLVEDEMLAVNVLLNYLEKKGDHEKALRKVLLDKEYASKAEIAAVMAEHLLGPLAPGKYQIDSWIKDGLHECPCGCNSKVMYGNTGIGHEQVWHGFIDILFWSQENSLNVATLVAEKGQHLNADYKRQSAQDTPPPSKRIKTEDEESSEEDSLDEEKLSEEKLSISGYENQAVSQTIVFSMLQRRNRPVFQHHLVPNIVISQDEFYIILYDASKDILLCTPKYPIFGETTVSVLPVPVILIFWMVLHHKLLCSGVPEREFLNGVKSNFKLRASEAWPIYSEQLKECASYFPQIASNHLECDLSTYYKEVSFD